MKPGRKSLASLASVPPLPLDARPESWPNLVPPEAELWRNVVQSLPADWFRPADLPILAAYCQAAAQHQEAGKQLAKSSLLLTDRFGKFYRNPLLAIQHQAALRMAALAVKLRLCPSTRYGARSAASAMKSTSEGKKPWSI